MLLISQILTAQTTLKDQLTAVHEAFGVNFVYDSSLDLEQIAGCSCHSERIEESQP